MENCIFCKIAGKTAPADIILESDNVVSFKNIDPVADVHVLIIPKSHIPSFLELDNLSDMQKMAKELIEKLNIKNAYKLIFNGGKYQAIPHAHWHLLGGEMHDKSDALQNT